MNEQPPLSLYLHLPWCVRKCPYCDFNSHTAGESAPKDRYIRAVESDLRSEAARAAGRSLVSVFIGGGTPSFFEGREIGRLIEVIGAEFCLQPDIEITMEANPGTVEHGDLEEYRLAGVNRLSLGGQSFDAESLQRLGRIHGPEEIHACYEGARAAGFENINIDLMFALPGQNLEMAIQDVEQATSLEPEHISYYQLTLEPNTVFYSNPPSDLPDEDVTAAIQEQCRELLAKHAYEQYEISAFARAGRQCRHNLNYWRFGDYVAVGAGAHGKFSQGRTIRRYEKPRHPLTYIEQAESGRIDSPEHEVSGPDRTFEYMLNALRLTDGFTVDEYVARTGLPVATVEDRLKLVAKKGMIEHLDGIGWRPTTLGLRFQNDLTAAFLP